MANRDTTPVGAPRWIGAQFTLVASHDTAGRA